MIIVEDFSRVKAALVNLVLIAPFSQFFVVIFDHTIHIVDKTLGTLGLFSLPSPHSNFVVQLILARIFGI